MSPQGALIARAYVSALSPCWFAAQPAYLPIVLFHCPEILSFGQPFARSSDDHRGMASEDGTVFWPMHVSRN
ncbi:MAG: hypothetical protein ACNA76_09955, partial [Anaerosomatales bacterium]